MIRLGIPRGIVYHRVMQDLAHLFRAFFVNLSDDDTILRFEKKFAEYMGVKHCLAFPFARTAIHFALKARELPVGSEIIMPPITIKQILDVVLASGLKPVFVDIDPETLCFDAEKFEKAIGPNTKAVLITYLFGMVPNVQDLISLSRKNGLFIIEDFSQCLNGRYSGKKVGTFGDVGIYSSSSIKTLDTYGGGLLICEDRELFQRLMAFRKGLSPASRVALIKKICVDLFRNVATTRMVFHFFTFPLLRFATKKDPHSAIKHVGTRNTQMLPQLPSAWFERYTSLQAEIGLKLLPGVQEGDLKRQKNVGLLKSWTKNGARFPKGTPNAENVYWQLMAYFDKPIEALRYFQAKKIDTSTTSLIHIASLPNYPYQGVTPNAGRLHSNGLFIPAYPGLSEQEIRHIAESLDHAPADSLV